MMSALNRYSRHALFVIALLLPAACGDTTGPAFGPPAHLQILSANLRGPVTLELAVPVQLQVTDARGRPVPEVGVTWVVASGNGTIRAATTPTDSAGIASAHWTLGSAAGPQHLDATVSGLPSVRITASAEAGPAHRIVIDRDSIRFDALGDTAYIRAHAEDVHGNTASATLSWITSDGSIAGVANGTITAHGNGSAQVSVSAAGASAAVYVNVQQRVTSLDILPFNDTINAVGHTRQLAAVARDRNHRAVTARRVSWTALDTSIEVDSTGLVRFIMPGGYGAMRIRAAVEGEADTVRVFVRQVAKSVHATADSMALEVGQQILLGAFEADSAGAPIPNTMLSYSSADTSIASIDAQGRITARASGSALITVRSGTSPGLVATSRITVYPSILIITIEPASTALPVGDSVQLATTRNWPGGFFWRSHAPAVASVSATGMVRALSAGQAVISAIAAQDTTLRATAVVTVTPAPLCSGAGAIALDLPLGGHVRRLASAGDALRCLSFELSRANGQQYLVMFENMPMSGGYYDGLFPGNTSPNSFTATISTSGAAAAPAIAAASEPVQLAAGTTTGWDFGAGRIYEANVRAPLPPSSEPRLLRADGQLVDMSSAVEPAVGDTVVVYMDGVPRLNIGPGNQRAVIRHISNELIIAEDVRLQTTLQRQNGQFNAPLSALTMSAIATEYAAYAKVQGDALFAQRFNSAIEASTPRRVLAVHTLMMADNVWGYTYGAGNYFLFDYWVNTNGSTAGIAQLPQVVTDNLFMHEVAHLRHWGLAERAGKAGDPGNQWLVEGFARFSERLPIAARLLGTQTPSRTGNLLLPYNPALNGAYYRNDVPTFLTGWQSAFEGYDHSSYLFDYLADHTALSGADPYAALRDLAVAAGTRAEADAAVARWLPGLTLGELFTRARIALYTDDNGVTGTVPWTQYLQYQLRASRPAGAATSLDPINLWPGIQPGTAFNQTRTLESGSAWGYLIDGVAAAGDAAIRIDAVAGDNGIISVTRIR